jgi:hypothetical protein
LAFFSNARLVIFIPRCARGAGSEVGSEVGSELVGAERRTVGRSNDRTRATARASVDGAVRAIKITPRASRAVTGVDARDDVLGGIARDDVRRRAAI